MRVTVLGAGYMGSALAEVAATRGHEVRLWGTWLDDALIEAVEEGRAHPRLRKPLDARVSPVRSAHLADALSGAELVVHAVSSEGLVPVLERAAEHLPDVPLLSVTKGFLLGASGTMERVDETAAAVVGRPLRYVHAAGPAKAVEVARDVLTWMSFASRDEADARACADAMRGPRLRVGVTTDLSGSVICSALKNAYATGLGLWDGLVGPDCHNARAACFQQAIVEMTKLTLAGGGRLETACGAAGVGDLHVTAAAGRNRAFGQRVGEGTPAKTVAAEMLATGELTEGYPAIASAFRWAGERGVRDLPLLAALHRIVWEGADVAATLADLELSV